MEAPQAQAVRDDEDARERHRGRGDDRVEQPGSGERDRGDVVGERPEQVALDRRERAAREPDRVDRAARRSPETSVRSAASIATSVPVPIARPRSAWASAGASLTPSPTIATTSPSRCSARDHGRLVGREHVGDHLARSRPRPATDRAARSLSPVSRIGLETELAQERRPPRRWRASACRRRATSPRTAPSQPTAIAVMPSASALSCSASSRGAELEPRSASSAVRPTTTARPSTTASTPRPARLPNRSTAGSPPSFSRAWAAIASAIGCSLALSAAPAKRSSSRSLAPVRHHPADTHAAVGDGAGLVEHDRRDPPRLLEHLRPLDQDPELRAAAGPDHERRGSREAECARAGDDQHGDGRGEGVRGVAGDDQPAGERQQGDADHDGHEDGRRLDRRDAGSAPCPPAPPSTSRAICASAVSAPTRAARTTSLPNVLIVAPATSLPGPTSTGTGSPVSID